MTGACGGSAHWMQLFDSSESRADEVSRFLRDGFIEGSPQLVVVTPVHWMAIADRLRAYGLPAEAALATGRLTVRDARPTLESITPSGLPDPEAFDRTVGELVRGLARPGRQPRIYGEMVDLLAADGAFAAVQRLEQLWNALAEREAFTLFCGYSAENFGSPRSAGALRAICRVHSRIRTSPRDVLGAFLVESTTTLVRPGETAH